MSLAERHSGQNRTNQAEFGPFLHKYGSFLSTVAEKWLQEVYKWLPRCFLLGPGQST